ncbi:MAG: 2Fe-2S iron-sulfur cluster-binding protein, partial [Gemmataceae bacterium]
GAGEYEVPQEKRLVLALTDEAGIDQLHACGGIGRCTTCRVEIIKGEPGKITEAEKKILEAKGISGVRLSCQMLCQGDMSIRVISRLEGSGRVNSGNRPTDQIQPEPIVWLDR